ncbi:MAG: hypothetical protein LBN99_04885 [Oscillospiraceae bacterium]|nr:hypothetical protein [Oscillospiraceae bacterium]
MGELLEWPGHGNVLGYFEDGAVYLNLFNNKIKLGTYEYDADGKYCSFSYDDERIGAYLPNSSGGMIFFETSKAAEYFTGQEFIFPEDEALQTVVFKGDPVGAAAAFVILYYGYGAIDQDLRRKFLK